MRLSEEGAVSKRTALVDALVSTRTSSRTRVLLQGLVKAIAPHLRSIKSDHAELSARVERLERELKGEVDER